MGKYIFDQYSLLHFTSGIVRRYFNFSLTFLFIFHIIFEYIENTKKGMYVINNYLKIWPGGKTSSDALINSIGDIIISLIGWICMDFLVIKKYQLFCCGITSEKKFIDGLKENYNERTDYIIIRDINKKSIKV